MHGGRNGISDCIASGSEVDPAQGSTEDGSTTFSAYVLPREQGQKYELVARGSKCDTSAAGQRGEQKAA